MRHADPASSLESFGDVALPLIRSDDGSTIAPRRAGGGGVFIRRTGETRRSILPGSARQSYTRRASGSKVAVAMPKLGAEEGAMRARGPGSLCLTAPGEHGHELRRRDSRDGEFLPSLCLLTDGEPNELVTCSR
jgi:hypothetical protein